MTDFQKPSTTIDEQLQILRDRGLIIEDEERARRYLANISYFRLSAYARPFYRTADTEHAFKPGTSFEDVLRLYIFDRQLRLLLMDALERIEVALRAQLTNTLADHYGPHGYLDPSLYDDRYDFGWIASKLSKATYARDAEPFLAHYRDKYVEAPDAPPVWMAMEILTFREVSILFSKLRRSQDKQRIEHHFGWKFPVLRSWFRSLSDLRNTCAHHGRVWNREFGSFPEIPRKVKQPWPRIPGRIPIPDTGNTLSPQRRLFMMVVVVQALMNGVSPGSSWAGRLVTLLNEYHHVPRWPMGFHEGWQEDPFWQSALKRAEEERDEV